MYIIFYGALGKTGKLSERIGGGESGNIKTINIISNLGYNVEFIRKPYPKKNAENNNWRERFVYLMELEWTVFSLVYKILKFRK